MRDVERLRDRIELSLDDRQVVALAICGLLLLGGVFSLGILLGKRLSSLQGPVTAAGDLAALDAQTRRFDPVPSPPARPPVPAKPAAVVAEPAARTTESVERPEPARATSVVAAAPSKATVVPAPTPRAVQVAAATSIALTPPPRDVGDFTVQIGASQDRTDAARLEARARGAGLKPYVMEAYLGSKGLWYRVRVGVFRERDSASRFRTDVERELRTAAVVMPTH
jgi:cell division septation protein DedD